MYIRFPIAIVGFYISRPLVFRREFEIRPHRVEVNIDFHVLDERPREFFREENTILRSSFLFGGSFLPPICPLLRGPRTALLPLSLLMAIVSSPFLRGIRRVVVYGFVYEFAAVDATAAGDAVADRIRCPCTAFSFPLQVAIN